MMVSNCPRCQIVRGVKLSSLHGRCQIVLFCMMVSNCPKCQIVLGVKLSAVSNCPITENLIGDAFFLSLGNLPMAYEEFYDYQA